MTLWVTHIQAIDPKSGELLTWQGPNVPGYTAALAQEWCELHGLGYCKVVARLECEVDILPTGGLRYRWVREVRDN